MANKPPAFQFYAKDFLSSPSIRTMSLPGVGAYTMLLASAWDSDPIATLPDNDDKLRRLAGASAQEWTDIRGEVMSNFEPFSEAGLLVNARLRQQYEELVSYSKTTSSRGKAGAKARWGKKDDAQSNAQAMPDTCLPMALQSASASASSTSSSIQSNSLEQNGPDGLKPFRTPKPNPPLPEMVKQIITDYPMTPLNSAVERKWKLAIEVEIENMIPPNNTWCDRDTAASWLLHQVQRYAASKPAKVYALDKFVRDGHYDRDWDPPETAFKVEDVSDTEGDTFKVEDVDDADGLV
jgi:uncharacterized protein YdaU (DUF1376 family)